MSTERTYHSKRCGVSYEMVRKYREAIYQSLLDSPTRTVKRKGKPYTMQVGNMGKHASHEAIA